MYRYFVAIAVAAGCFSLSGPSAHAQNAEAGQSVFKRNCAICHDPAAGRNKSGPSLFGVVGRPAGSAPNFHYSDNNKKSGLSWDAATLDRYLTAPRTVVPGTTMSFGGLKDEQQRHDLIAYLATLK